MGSRMFVIFFFAVFLALPIGKPALAQAKRPLLLIPGILGSQLCDSAGNVVWGKAGSLWNFARLEITPSGPLEPLKPCGPLTTVVSLGPFWQQDIYTPLLNSLHEWGFVDGQDLFVFDYDWRQSNRDTADRLVEYVLAHPKLLDGEFDILAHSMGGIVARLFIRNPDHPGHVNRLISMGTPFQGAARALQVLAGGWGTIPNKLAGGMDTIRRVVLSFPAFYELLPDYRFGRDCCRLGRPGQPGWKAVTIWDAAVWDRYGWLPAEYRSGAGRTYFGTLLGQARDVQGEVHQRPQQSPPEIHFVGSKLDTPLYLYADPAKPGLNDWQFTSGEGDSVVPKWSAGDADAKGNIDDPRPAFPTHATIFTDDHLTETLRLLLADAPAPRKGSGDTVDTSEGTKRLSGVDISADPYFVERAGDPVRVRVTLRLGDPLGQASTEVRAWQSSVATAPVTSLSDVTSPEERSADTLRLEGPVLVVGTPGTHRVDISIPGAGTQSIYVELVE